MEKKLFKSESKELLNLMIHSIYSNKDIFLRELVSNASDALDKREFLKIQGKVKAEGDGKITVSVDKKIRTITITDNGIGMNEKELDENLGTIAHSGSKEFIEKLSEENSMDIIGQFGVGFYSSFIVSDKVEVITKKEKGSTFKWTSD
ncbi:MAG: ATP-binding protein, partial [Mycoplasmatales bacterium]